MANREQAVLRALAAVYDLAAEVADDGRAHDAALAARECIALAASIAGVKVLGVGHVDDHEWRARQRIAGAVE